MIVTPSAADRESQDGAAQGVELVVNDVHFQLCLVRIDKRPGADG